MQIGYILNVASEVDHVKHEGIAFFKLVIEDIFSGTNKIFVICIFDNDEDIMDDGKHQHGTFEQAFQIIGLCLHIFLLTYCSSVPLYSLSPSFFR